MSVSITHQNITDERINRGAVHNHWVDDKERTAEGDGIGVDIGNNTRAMSGCGQLYIVIGGLDTTNSVIRDVCKKKFPGMKHGQSMFGLADIPNFAI